MKTLRIVAPASPLNVIDDETVAKMKMCFGALGWNATWSDRIFSVNRFLCGSDEERAADINEAFADKSVDAVIALRGGYGSARILDKIDFAMIRENPKPFLGFSDITALQMGLFKLGNLPSWTGFTANMFLRPIPELTLNSLQSALRNENQEFDNLEMLVPGTAEGELLGGTSIVLESLLGTKYFPDFNGKILLLEEVGEAPYKVDRIFTHLRLAGLFEQISGLVLGIFSGCVNRGETNLDGTVENVIFDHFANASFPVAINFMYGHPAEHYIFPIGTMAKLDNGKLNIDRVSFCNDAV